MSIFFSTKYQHGDVFQCRWRRNSFEMPHCSLNKVGCSWFRFFTTLFVVSTFIVLVLGLEMIFSAGQKGHFCLSLKHSDVSLKCFGIINMTAWWRSMCELCKLDICASGASDLDWYEAWSPKIIFVNMSEIQTKSDRPALRPAAGSWQGGWSSLQV